MKKFYRNFIDFLVIVMALIFLLPVVVSILTPYDNDTLPDDVIALDEEIVYLLETLPTTFQDLYHEPDSGHIVSLTRKSNLPILSDTDNYAQNAESIVYITTEGYFGETYTGSGSILTEDGVILTNNHLFIDAERAVVTTHDGQHHPVVGVLASDELMDVLFLKIDASELKPIVVGDSDSVSVGDKSLVIGNPEGLLRTLSVGNISGFRDYVTTGEGKQIQMTNPISMGNSGGALLNERGELIGIPTWSVEYYDNIVQVQNLNFAVPINEALSVLGENEVEWEAGF